jgi:uncharacterized protein (DUF2336 family)
VNFMSVATSLIPGLDKLVRQGDSRRLADAVRRIAELLVQKAATFRPDHIDLFDHVLIDLVPHAAIAARAELAWQLSALANGPKILLGQLAREDELSVAGPVLRRSPVLDEKMLIEIARIKGQGHLLAITERPALSADLTDVILRRADRDVVRRVAANAGALFSESGYSALIRRAGTDGVLTLKLGQREDLPDRLLKALLAGSIEIVRRRLFEIATPERQAAIGRAMSEIGTDSGRIENGKDFVPAQRAVLALHRAGNLNEAALLGFAKEYRYEEAVAALSAMSGVQLATLDRLVSGERHDPILIVGKAIGLQWATVRAPILLRLGPSRIASPTDIENARSKFARLMPSTAERMLSFWQARQSA